MRADKDANNEDLGSTFAVVDDEVDVADAALAFSGIFASELGDISGAMGGRRRRRTRKNKGKKSRKGKSRKNKRRSHRRR